VLGQEKRFGLNQQHADAAAEAMLAPDREAQAARRRIEAQRSKSVVRRPSALLRFAGVAVAPRSRLGRRLFDRPDRHVLRVWSRLCH